MWLQNGARSISGPDQGNGGPDQHSWYDSGGRSSVRPQLVRTGSGPGPDEGSCSAPFDLSNLGPDEPGLGPDEGDVQQLIKVRFYQF